MPSRYVIREFAPESVYHVFNRGVEKRVIFRDEEDHKIFLYYLYIYLTPLNKVLKSYPALPLRLHNKNLSQELNLLSYCLMPNHIHFLLKQKTGNAVSRLMKQLTNAYTEYFNKKYHRNGSLMQGRFKAVRVWSDEVLLHLSRYIHLNPLVVGVVNELDSYKWSSYLAFIGKNATSFVEKQTILSHFKSAKDYERFVQDQEEYAKELARIKHLTID